MNNHDIQIYKTENVVTFNFIWVALQGHFGPKFSEISKYNHNNTRSNKASKFNLVLQQL